MTSTPQFTLSGAPVPPLVLGTMHFGTRTPVEQAHDLLDRAADLGVTFLDTANNYAFWHPGGTGDESETCLGAWFSTRSTRDRVILATKVGARPGYPGGDLSSALGLSGRAIKAQVEDSLHRLRTDHVDVIYAHVDDHSVDLEETVEALQDLIDRGLANAIACSNTTASRLAEALTAAGDGPGYAAVQNRFTYLTPLAGADLAPHVLLDDGVIEVARSSGVLAVAHSVLLEGAYTRPDRPLHPGYGDRTRQSTALAALDEVAAECGLDAGQAVLAWMTQRPSAVLPVVGISNAGQLEAAWQAVHTVLPPEALAALDDARR
ncbi:aldo/keto reductase [Saccharothrix sp. NRRL B-16314]|uniref:aldo/keto reductase n=1 Tax=Saccharothrix sp. NRRL B-16314 TaxID=1463825 RepID=UPI00069228C6|nr:aldo/keto reductase [Saccharothrix sp. NRRL B-16314]